MTNVRGQCPECESWVALPSDVIAGEFIKCTVCSERLAVISLNPPELDYAEQQEWDDD